MSSLSSVTEWIERAKAGNEEAFQKLWRRFFKRLVGLARTRLKAMPRPADADPEQVAESALFTFWRGAVMGKFRKVSERDHLLKLLQRITVFKANGDLDRAFALKRGGGRARDEGILMGPNDSSPTAGLEQVLDREPSPALAAEMAETLQELIKCLEDDERQIAKLQMDGLTQAQIAGHCKCSLRTVVNKLGTIRGKWKAVIGQ